MERHPGFYFLAVCPCSSESASLSFDFWIYKMGTIVASSSQSCREEKISMLPGHRWSPITIVIFTYKGSPIRLALC